MLEIRNNYELHFNRGDSFNIQLYCSNGTFETGDKIYFHVLEVGKAGSPEVLQETQNRPSGWKTLLEKEIKSNSGEAGTNTCLLHFHSSDTRFEELKTKNEKGTLIPALQTGYKKYWYEVELQKTCNNVQPGDANKKDGITLIGYDSNGPKLMYVYPEAVSTENV